MFNDFSLLNKTGTFRSKAMLEIIKILSHFPLPLSGTGPDGRITKKDVESFVPSKAAPVSRLEICGNGCYRDGKALWKGSSYMELALLDFVGCGACKIVKFNLSQTQMKLSPFICPFDIPLRKKPVCSQPFLWLLNLHGPRSAWSQLVQHC